MMMNGISASTIPPTPREISASASAGNSKWRPLSRLQPMPNASALSASHNASCNARTLDIQPPSPHLHHLPPCEQAREEDTRFRLARIQPQKKAWRTYGWTDENDGETDPPFSQRSECASPCA